MIFSIEKTFDFDIKIVWNVITNFKKYHWRSELSRVDIINEKEFIEVTKDGYLTNFKIIKEEKFKYLEFKINNSNLEGYWKGEFLVENGKTKIKFVEDLKAKKTWLTPILKIYVKRQQKIYMKNLEKYLYENVNKLGV
ncbi:MULTISPECIES: polyketide cyclase [Fusobacterium]|uniref:polyketide cyclase n=1 Tax=Fusobacterium TaxID=848 RepID=UPI001476A07A|nr:MULTISPECIES: polyketide cyclase [Fusobacterium]NME35163.1 polyketide cyclase [Fusobacterium sp. FSA-380-WT-3A]